MRHIYKRFFSKIEELRNYVKKKERTSEQCHELVKNKNRPILRGKIALMILFIRSHFVIDFNDIIYKISLCNRSFMHYNKATHKLCFLAKSTDSYRVGSHKIERIM